MILLDKIGKFLPDHVLIIRLKSRPKALRPVILYDTTTFQSYASRKFSTYFLSFLPFVKGRSSDDMSEQKGFISLFVHRSAKTHVSYPNSFVFLNHSK
jgi:hypothetical protein